MNLERNGTLPIVGLMCFLVVFLTVNGSFTTDVTSHTSLQSVTYSVPASFYLTQETNAGVASRPCFVVKILDFGWKSSILTI